MIVFSESAAFGRKIPFAALQKQGVPRRFGSLIKSIVWTGTMAVGRDDAGVAAHPPFRGPGGPKLLGRFVVGLST